MASRISQGSNIIGPLIADLRAESDALDALVEGLPVQTWAQPTPAPGWTIAHP